MQYKPLENAINYFIGLYQSAKDAAQKFGNSLMPSGLELAIAGAPNSVLKQTEDYSPEKSQGYFFAEYSVRGYQRNGRKVVVTRSDGKQIPLEPPKNGNFAEEAVKQALANNGISANNKLIGKIAKLLRGKS